MTKARIMVVEDEGIVALTIQRKLEDMGYEVPVLIDTGEEAIEQVSTIQPELILMDIMLAGELRGIETAEQILAHHDIPIIYLTAYSDDSTLQAAKATGPFGYLVKPFEEQVLRTTIEIALYKHEMNRKLRESEQWLATTLHSISDGVIATDKQDRVAFMNPAAEIITRWNEVEALGRDLMDVFNTIGQTNYDGLDIPTSNATQKGLQERTTDHTTLIARDGTEKPVAAEIAAIKDEKGDVTGNVLAFRDITEQVEAQETIGRYVERLEILRELDQTILAVLSPRHIAKTVLGHIRRLIPCLVAGVSTFDFSSYSGTVLATDGYKDVAQLPGREFSLGLFEDVIEVFQRDNIYIANENSAFSQILLDTKHIGGLCTVFSVPIVAHGELVGCLCLGLAEAVVFDEEQIEIIREVADQLAIGIQQAQLYEQVQHHAEELEARVAIRTSQLEAAQKAAETANRAKSTFLANMSHELRTPLNAILGFAQILESELSEQPDQQMKLKTIMNSGEHLLRLINEILDLSKIEAGQMALGNTNFDIYSMLEILEEMLGVQAEEKGLQMLFEFAPDVPRYVRADENKLRQVLINLLGNAIKFTNDGGVALRVGYQETDTPQLLFEIQDTGIGIPASALDGLFDPFVQVEGGQYLQEGTGLGLPISQKFVQMMGGDITVTSEVNKGSLFAFSIQAELAESADERIVDNPLRAIGLAPDQPPYRILIVEDRAENRMVLSAVLEPMGFEVREAINGQEAIEICRSWEPHLVFMDMQMPVMDGYEATKRLRTTKKGQAMVIIALTASAFEYSRQLALDAGCDDFVSKPFRTGVISEKISQHLGARFIYEERATASPSNELESDALAGLPQQWLHQLHRAAIELDPTEALRLIDQLRQQDEALASQLADLVDNYRFDTLQNLTQGQVNGTFDR